MLAGGIKLPQHVQNYIERLLLIQLAFPNTLAAYEERWYYKAEDARISDIRTYHNWQVRFLFPIELKSLKLESMYWRKAK